MMKFLRLRKMIFTKEAEWPYLMRVKDNQTKYEASVSVRLNYVFLTLIKKEILQFEVYFSRPWFVRCKKFVFTVKEVDGSVHCKMDNGDRFETCTPYFKRYVGEVDRFKRYKVYIRKSVIDESYLRERNK